MPVARKTCTVSPVETIGQRIERLRKARDLSRPELGRRMAEAIGRAKPYTGESVRQYEDNKISPRGPAAKALAAVFKITESQLLFGEPAHHVKQEPAHYVVDSEGKRRQLTAREDMLLDLFAGLFSLQQRETIDHLRALFDANQITRKELGQRVLRGVSNEAVRAAFGDVPKPGVRKPPARPHHKRKVGDLGDDPDAE